MVRLRALVVDLDGGFRGRAGAFRAARLRRVARRFCVSRGHVRNLLTAAAQARLLDYARSSQLTVRPALQEAILSFFAVLFLWFDRAAAASAWPDPFRPS